MSAIISLNARSQFFKVIRMCVCHEAVCNKVFPIVFDIVVIFVDFGFFLEELVEASPPSLSRS